MSDNFQVEGEIKGIEAKSDKKGPYFEYKVGFKKSVVVSDFECKFRLDSLKHDLGDKVEFDIIITTPEKPTTLDEVVAGLSDKSKVKNELIDFDPTDDQ